MNWREETHYNLISEDGEFRISIGFSMGKRQATLWRKRESAEPYTLPWRRINSFQSATEAKQAAEKMK